MAPGTLKDSHDRAEFASRLLRWYDQAKRDLPWRQTGDPYAIWLSEIMLQQTTVQTVTPRWKRFLGRWPTVEALAAAEREDVLHEWSGLGYYARARNLHAAAKIVADDFGGEFPRTAAELRNLPGMGDYTSAAVASIAFGEPVAVLDANVERVLTRILAFEENPRSGAGKKALRDIAGELIAPERSGDFNQGMMELGATYCTPQEPLCLYCPVREFCKAEKLGRQEKFPVLPKKAPFQNIEEAAMLIERDGAFLLLKRGAEHSFGGMWETPRAVCEEREKPHEAAARAARELLGIEAIVEPEEVLTVKHTVMRSRITLRVFRAKNFGGEPRNKGTMHEEFEWFGVEEWRKLPKSTAQRRVLEFVGRIR